MFPCRSVALKKKKRGMARKYAPVLYCPVKLDVLFNLCVWILFQNASNQFWLRFVIVFCFVFSGKGRFFCSLSAAGHCERERKRVCRSLQKRRVCRKMSSSESSEPSEKTGLSESSEKTEKTGLSESSEKTGLSESTEKTFFFFSFFFFFLHSLQRRLVCRSLQRRQRRRVFT